MVGGEERAEEDDAGPPPPTAPRGAGPAPRAGRVGRGGGGGWHADVRGGVFDSFRVLGSTKRTRGERAGGGVAAPARAVRRGRERGTP